MKMESKNLTKEEIERKRKEEEERKRQEKMKSKLISEDGTLASFGFSDNYN